MFIFSQKFRLDAMNVHERPIERLSQPQASVQCRLNKLKSKTKQACFTVFQSFRSAGACYKTQCKPGRLFTYVLKTTNTGTPKNRKNFQHFTIQGQGFYLSFSLNLLPGYLGVPGGRIRFSGFQNMPVVHMTIFSSEPNNAQKCFSPLRLTPTGYAVDSHFSKE